MDCSSFEIWPVFMIYLGKYLLLFMYNKQRRPLIRGLLTEPSDLGLHCLQVIYEIGSSTKRVKRDLVKLIISISDIDFIFIATAL